jgi:hypothetical protein
MDDNLTDMMEKFIHQSVANYKKWPYAGKAKISNWRICAALFKDGWACVDGHHPEDSNALILILRKEGEEEQRVRLSFTEQQLWLKYLERISKNEGEIIK